MCVHNVLYIHNMHTYAYVYVKYMKGFSLDSVVDLLVSLNLKHIIGSLYLL
jgi:hypothetical protein